MARIVQHRRGSTADLAGITGAVAELFVDTSKTTVVVMDGATPGGVPLATETSVTNSVSSINASIATVSSDLASAQVSIGEVSSVAVAAASAVSGAIVTINSVSSNLASLSSVVAGITVPTATTTSLGIVRPDNSSINVVDGVLSLGSSIATSWTIQTVSDALVFYFNGTAKLKFTSDGAIVAVDNVTAYGSI